MFPDSPYAHPVSSFERPVPLVTVDPDADPVVTFSVNRDWIPYILGSLKQLVLQSTWKYTTQEELDLVQARAMDLLKIVGLAFNGSGCECGCTEYPPSVDFVDWGPTNPYGPNPGYIPPHYRLPAWYVAGNTIIPGVHPGDVVTDLLHGPFAEGVPGIPQVPFFRINVNGTGKIEITFVRFPSAGLALIVVDGNLLGARYVDLHTSLSASIGSVDTSMIIPVDISNPGAHTIDVSMVFTVTESPPYAHFGGAIRQIALCGFDGKPKPKPIIFVDEMEYMMSVCEQLKFEDGVLKGLCCGDWVAIDGQSGGVVPSGVVQPNGSSRPAPGQSKCYNVLLNANNQWQLPFPVADGDTITITDANGAWSDGTTAWYCPDGTPFVLGICIGSQGHAGGDPDTTDYHMQAIAKVGSSYYPASNGIFTIPGGTGTQSLILQANDGTLDDNRGSISLNICVQNNATPPSTPWCFVMDLTASDYGFTALGGFGTYVPGVGWQAVSSAINIEIVFTPTPLTHIDFDYEWDGTCSGVSDETSIYDGPGFGTQLGVNGPLNAPSGNYAWDGIVVSGDITLAANATTGVCDTSVITIKRITWRGTDTNPFGSDNC